MTIDASHVGRRVVVRHVVGGSGPSGGPAMTDVVGRLVDVDATTALVERRDGTRAVVALGDVVTWKVVPDRPLRRRRAATTTADELTVITSRGWPALESEPLGDWELRASAGFTGRANSVAVTGDPGLPLDGALDAVVRFYAARSLPALAQVVVGSSWDRAFEQAGWVPGTGSRPGAMVQVAELDPTYAPDPRARVTARADDDWLARYERVAPEHRDVALAVLQGASTVGFVAIGSPAQAVGRVVVTGEWAGLAAVEVHPDARRQGLGRAVVETSLAWAVAHGADKAYLQTMHDNTAAIALYEPFGFVTHHDYRYLEPGVSVTRGGRSTASSRTANEHARNVQPVQSDPTR